MSDQTIVAIYADGGVIGRNPSVQGGTWAWCHVNAAGEHVAIGSGVVTPSDIRLPTVTNNVTEMMALTNGLLALPPGWSGRVYSDSQITLGRLFWSWKWNNIPPQMIDTARQAMQRLRWKEFQPILLDGHPTKAQLITGIGKRGAPVSEHNVWCDKECTRHAALFRELVIT